MLVELVLIASVVLTPVDRGADSSTTSSFQVIVHASNAATTVTRAQLSAIFLKRVRRWPSRVDVVPVDHPASSRLRETFSRSIHRKSVAFVTRYWHRLIFAGRAIPPLELSSDSAVLEYVSKNRGAIGYVSADAVLPEGVKTILVRP